jgi:hypothetical protein
VQTGEESSKASEEEQERMRERALEEKHTQKVQKFRTIMEEREKVRY